MGNSSTPDHEETTGTKSETPEEILEKKEKELEDLKKELIEKREIQSQLEAWNENHRKLICFKQWSPILITIIFLILLVIMTTKITIE